MSVAAGLKSGQFNRKKTLILCYRRVGQRADQYWRARWPALLFQLGLVSYKVVANLHLIYHQRWFVKIPHSEFKSHSFDKHLTPKTPGTNQQDQDDDQKESDKTRGNFRSPKKWRLMGIWAAVGESHWDILRSILAGELHHILPPCGMSSFFFGFWNFF